MKQWYQTFFENYSRQYDNENFTHGTFGECDFIEKEISYNKSLKILDIGCGTGRHSIELSKRGYQLTGIDLSEPMLTRARQKAAEAKVLVDFHQADARDLPFIAEFDLAIMLCEGGFSLMETDEMNFAILQSAAKALKTGGKLIFTTLNGLFPLFHSVKEFMDASANEGNAITLQTTFDLMTFRDYNVTSFVDDDGEEHRLECNERYYVPSEITWLLKSLGFHKIDIMGARLGEFSRDHVLKTEDFEMLVVAEK